MFRLNENLRLQGEASSVMSFFDQVTPASLVNARFVPTPLEAALDLPAKSVQVCTNSQMLLDRLLAFCRTCRAPVGSKKACVWKIVAEPGGQANSNPPDLSSNGMSHAGLTFIGLGGRSFLAYDRQAEQGISFVEEALVQQEHAFITYFLPALLSMLEESEV